tara:strand:- start:7004 stop:7612 length:609 start_codon:yes stop_codon:yes gene_type:complete
LKDLIRKILKEGELDWASEGTDDGDGNHIISVMGKLEQMLNLKKSIEEDLKKVKNPVVKKLGIEKAWGGEPLPMIQNQILKLKKILEAQTTGFGKVDWQSIVVSKEVGDGFVGENDYHLENYMDRMRDMGLEPNVKENHPYKVDPEELGGDYIRGNLIWVLDVNPTKDGLEYMYSDQDGSYDTDVNLSSIREVGEDYLKFGK